MKHKFKGGDLLKRDVLAIVGSTYDITGIATCSNALLYDSNPSRVYGGAGGAGRNIGENMARMGMDTGIISSYGTDVFSLELMNACKEAGMDVSHCFVEANGTSCMYISLLDQAGELLLAAADLSLHESIDPNRIDEQADYINEFQIVYVDTNNTEEQLRHIAAVAEGRLFADTVSISKAVRLRSILGHLDTLKTNRGELEELAGMNCPTLEELKDGARALINCGVKRVFVTMGKEGSFCCTADEFHMIPSFPTEVKNVTGAGDAFAAALAYGSLKGFSNKELLILGTAASRIALQSPYAVNSEMSEEKLLATYDELKKLL